jgi:predicted phosphodiesterase
LKIQLLSDLHLEFHRDGGRSFVESLAPEGVDVLVLAGDIAVGGAVRESLALFCRRYRTSFVVYVNGNHEFYGTDRAGVLEQCRAAAEDHANLVWLDASVAEVMGRRFLGAPLWFRRHPDTPRLREAMTDFSVIRDFESWVYEENARAVELFERELREGDIVVTHHLPSERSVAPRFVGNPLNPFFVCDVEPLIRERQPRFWLHGHTHCSLRYDIGKTSVVCNPFGYAGIELNPDFSENLLVEA